MYICCMKSTELLKGTLKTILLKLLAENERMYGYEMTQRVKVLTAGKLELTEGALYPALHKLEAEGLVTVERVKVGKRMRKYYSLTPSGSAATVNRLEEFEEFVQTMRLIFKPKTDWR